MGASVEEPRATVACKVLTEAVRGQCACRVRVCSSSWLASITPAPWTSSGSLGAQTQGYGGEMSRGLSSLTDVPCAKTRESTAW